MSAVWQCSRVLHNLILGRTKLGYVVRNGSKWTAVVLEDDRVGRFYDDTDRKTLRDAKAWVEARVTPPPACPRYWYRPDDDFNGKRCELPAGHVSPCGPKPPAVV